MFSRHRNQLVMPMRPEFNRQSLRPTKPGSKARLRRQRHLPKEVTHVVISTRLPPRLSQRPPAHCSTRMRLTLYWVSPTPVFKIASTRNRNDDIGLYLPASPTIPARLAASNVRALRCSFSSPQENPNQISVAYSLMDAVRSWDANIKQ